MSTVRNHVCATAQKALVERGAVVLMRAHATDERLARLLAAADGGHEKVVPRGPVERYRDRRVSERLADRSGQIAQTFRQAGARPCQTRHFDQAPEGACGLALRHSYANFPFTDESYRRKRPGP